MITTIFKKILSHSPSLHLRTWKMILMGNRSQTPRKLTNFQTLKIWTSVTSTIAYQSKSKMTKFILNNFKYALKIKKILKAGIWTNLLKIKWSNLPIQLRLRTKLLSFLKNKILILILILNNRRTIWVVWSK